MQNKFVINKTKYLLEPEVESLEKILYSQLDKDTRNSLLIWTGLRTGARATELVSIKKSDLNAHDRSVFIRGIKNSNDREIPLPKQLFDCLSKYSNTVSGDLLFPISYNRLHQIWDTYRPVRKKLHSLRHTFAITIYRKTKDIKLLQIALGHRNIVNTMIYADFLYTQQEMRKIL